jgi:CYTH domain-containing protein
MKEIERKFLINVDLEYLLQATNTNSDIYDGLHGEYFGFRVITQHYLKDTGDWAIRVRRSTRMVDYGEGWVTEDEYVQTMKRRICDQSSIEVEEEITKKAFDYLSGDRNLTTPALIKRRHNIGYQNCNYIWEVDEFLNPEYVGLVLAEIELEKVNQTLPIPFWVGEEVTNDKKYRNARMSRKLER